MKKRPLASIGLLLVLLFYLAVTMQGLPSRAEYESPGDRVCVSGRVYQKELRPQAGEMVQVLYLKDLSEESPPGKAAVCYLKNGQAEPEMGSWVKVEGVYKNFERASNPGQFDTYSFYLISGISYRLNQAVILEKTTKYNKVREGIYCFRRFLSRKLSTYLPPKESALMKTILLGEKGELDPELKELYQRNGIAHLLAISGLHVSMLGMGLYRILCKCGVPMKISAGGACVLLVLYGVMTGFSVSALRAILMFLLHMLAVMAERTYDLLTALSVAAVSLLVGQPLYLKHSGFLFSFGCVLGIAVLTPALTEGKRDLLPGNNILTKGIKGGLSAFSMGVATLPVYLWYYYQFPVWSVLLNLMVIPLMSYLMAAGILLLILSIVCPLAIWPLVSLIRGIFKIYELGCGVNETLPFHLVNFGKPQGWQLLFYLLILLLVVGLKKKLTLPVKWMFTCLGILLLVYRPGGKLTVTFLDVGQGDGIFIETPQGSHFLIDGGSSSVGNVGKYRLLPFLRFQGVQSLDAVFVTHPDTDHCNGVQEILEQDTGSGITVKCLALPDIAGETKSDGFRKLEGLAEERGIPVVYLSRGQEMGEGELTFTCLHPSKGYRTKDTNEYSLVLKLTYQNFSALFTGDLEGEGEQDFEKYQEGKAGNRGQLTVLKAAHHGSAYSTGTGLLEVLMPSYTVISCGKHNSYGHPHQELLKRLADCGTEILITYQTGAVTFQTDGEQVWIQTFLIEELAPD